MGACCFCEAAGGGSGETCLTLEQMGEIHNKKLTAHGLVGNEGASGCTGRRVLLLRFVEKRIGNGGRWGPENGRIV